MIHQVLRDKIKEATKEILQDVIQFRHTCHQHPERTWQEVETAERVAKHLSKIPNLKIEKGVGKLGVVAILEGAKPGPTIGLRADMDALPLMELNDLPYKSQNDGTMHACGHDGHMANLYGAALVLSRFQEDLHGTVKFIFQPAEEGGAGALKMCEDGVLEDPKVDVIFGMHGWPEAPEGEIWLKDGPQMASNSQFSILIEGVGCHAAMPHLGTDQVLIAARCIESLQSISSRFVSPVEPIALTVSKVTTGEAINIIPHQVKLEGTLRTVSNSTRDQIKEAVQRLVQGVCSGHGVSGTVDFTDIYPATVNHSIASDYVEKVVGDVLGAKQLKRIESPSMGAEDFSFYLERVPGCFFFLGLDDGKRDAYPSLHHPEFDYNDKTLPTSIELFSSLALCSHLEFTPTLS